MCDRGAYARRAQGVTGESVAHYLPRIRARRAQSLARPMGRRLGASPLSSTLTGDKIG